MSILKLEGITKSFGGLIAVNNVSFEVKEGEIFGLIGPNGSGKTTLFNLINHYFSVTSGRITFKNQNITNKKTFEIARLGIGRTFQVVRPFSFMSVLENVMAAYGVRFYYNIAKSFGKWKKNKYIEKVEAILKETELLEYKNRKANTLPLGIQRRLEIARALAVNPQVILLDESFSGLSFSEIDRLKRLVKNINTEGVTVVVIEHNMPVVMDLCRNVVVLNYGKKLAEGRPQEIVKNPEVIEAYIGKRRYA